MLRQILGKIKTLKKIKHWAFGQNPVPIALYPQKTPSRGRVLFSYLTSPLLEKEAVELYQQGEFQAPH